MVQDWSRDAVPRHQSYAQPRFHHTEAYDQRRYYDMPETVRQPPMTIDQALRSHCGISGKQYFVAVILDDGTPATFFSPGQKLENEVLKEFFDAEKFKSVAKSLELSPVGTSLSDYPAFNNFVRGNRYPPNRRRMFGDDGESEDLQPQSARKRQRQRPYEEDVVQPPIPQSRRKIQLQEQDLLWSFYDQRFKSCQQSACKLIAKAWVKAVEPKKQSTHPYTGSDEKAPDWWPKPWGNTKEDKVRHKEPDHLYKRERVHLLNHILRLVVQPNMKQHPDIKKLQLSVKKLEECTNEALSGFYAESPTNLGKKQYLDEIFKIATQQERYLRGELDGTVEVYVLDNDRSLDEHTSENDGGPISREDDDPNPSPSARSSAAQGFLPAPGAGHPAQTNPHSSGFLNELPLRSSQHHPPQPTPVLHDMSSQHHEFVGTPMPVNGAPSVNPPPANLGVDMVPSPQDAGRRPSVYGEYGGNSMYQQHWQPSGTTSSEQHQSIYTQQAHPQPQPFVQPVPVTNSQPYVPNSFSDLPRPGYDPNTGQMFRPAEVPQGSVNGHSGYNYLPNDNRGMTALPGVSEVMDSVPRGGGQM